MATTLLPPTPTWTAADLKEWRGRLRWTQARAASALEYHLEAYKRLEGGTRSVAPRVRKLALLIEREHVRAMHVVSGSGSGRMLFSTVERAAARLDALEADRDTTSRNGCPKIRYVSLFSGLEGATVALERIGAPAVPIAFADVDPASNAVCRHRWPSVPRLGDVTADLDWSPLRGRVDLVIGGPPCQAFSVAGRKLGLADPRGNLMLHFLRAVGAIAPRWFVMENVPGLITVGNGADFGVVLDAVEELGYACAWRVLDPHRGGFGLPQRRRRLFLVGERAGDGSGPGEILDLVDRNFRGAPARRKKGRQRWKSNARRIEGCLDDEAPDIDWSEAAAWLNKPAVVPDPVEMPPRGKSTVGEVVAFKIGQGHASRSEGASAAAAPTLAGTSGGSRTPGVAYVLAADLRHGTLADVASTLQVGPTGTGWSLNAQPIAVLPSEAGAVIRRFTPIECGRLQGLDDDHLVGVRLNGKPLSDGEKYRLLGNSFPIPVICWILERLIARHYSAPPAGSLPTRRPAASPP